MFNYKKFAKQQQTSPNKELKDLLDKVERDCPEMDLEGFKEIRKRIEVYHYSLLKKEHRSKFYRIINLILFKAYYFRSPYSDGVVYSSMYSIDIGGGILILKNTYSTVMFTLNEIIFEYEFHKGRIALDLKTPFSVLEPLVRLTVTK